MTIVAFWAAAALVVYTYLLFPLLVMLRARLRPKPYRAADIQPSVSMIIAAYNEENTIAAKLENILSLDYPRERLEVLIASDGSSDNTDEIVRRYADRGVRLLSLPRQGKAAALNAAVAASRGEILVFSDANSMYAPDALQALVRPFADPEVGGVAGNQRYLDPREDDDSAAGERAYWNFDRQLKRSQSQAGNAISATGAIYAIRRSLFRTVPPGVTDDFYTSTGVIAQGYRLVFAPDAVAYEPAATSNEVEFGRKVRVITRGLRAVWVMRELLNPFRYGFYAIQLFSHKVLRRLVVFPLLVVLLTSLPLWGRGVVYRAAAVAQALLYSCALLGFALRGTRLGRRKILALPFYFCTVNTAAFMAALNLARGRQIDRWDPQRPGSPTAAKMAAPALQERKLS